MMNGSSATKAGDQKAIRPPTDPHFCLRRKGEREKKVGAFIGQKNQNSSVVFRVIAIGLRVVYRPSWCLSLAFGK